MSVEKTTGGSADLRAIADESIEPGLPWGEQLRDLATAMATGRRLDVARDALVHSASREVAAAAVGVCANFQMMNLILDATGCPVPERLRFVEDLLGISRRS
ncbi:hypothetical protein [Geodermatophilus chilensis]|uniref:hypothetical protein n=1 Tax=Geodermatophilus chilensis TaxID=2035835 RepID=UPI0012FFF50A|nr:hypothetical protein [Geodermatophilus chilensis]